MSIMSDASISFAEKKVLVKNVFRGNGIKRGRRYRYSKMLVCATYQLILAVREDSIASVEQRKQRGAVTTIVKFRYSGMDYEMSVCERRTNTDGRFCWINIQMLPHMTDYDITFKVPFDEHITYERILGELKALRDKNSGKITAHKRNEQDRRNRNKQRADGRKRKV